MTRVARRMPCHLPAQMYMVPIWNDGQTNASELTA
jgi:hypothetical protein